jgi:hypothetical protein
VRGAFQLAFIRVLPVVQVQLARCCCWGVQTIQQQRCNAAAHVQPRHHLTAAAAAADMPAVSTNIYIKQQCTYLLQRVALGEK